jgi:hypothetical protein
MTVASTSAITYHKEVKGKTNKQNEIVLKAMRRLGTTSSANEIMVTTSLFTDDQQPLKINIVTRVLHDLREEHKKISYIDVKERKEGGRVVHHHFIIEEGKQTSIF